MAGKTTRNYYQQMLDFIKEEGFCILPSNLIETLIKEKHKTPNSYIHCKKTSQQPLII